MGAFQSSKKKKSKVTTVGIGDDPILQLQAEFDTQYKIPREIQIAHFMPSIFPVVPKISKAVSEVCTSSWQTILSQTRTDENGNMSSGLTLFYTLFYERLDSIDRNGRFESVLLNGFQSSIENKIALKGAILVRIMNYVLKIEEDNQQTQYMLYMLGKAHTKKDIRPWQYAAFIETLMYTIQDTLREKGDDNTMSAWVNLFGYAMQSMLASALDGRVVETELNIATKTVFDEGRIADEVSDADEMSLMKKKMNSMQSSRCNSTKNSARSNYSDYNDIGSRDQRDDQ